MNGYPTRGVLIHFASLTEPLVKLATNLIGDLGVAGTFLLTMTSAVIGVPGTEPTMLFSGFDVYNGHLSMAAIIIAGVIGDVVGGSIAYGDRLLGPPRAIRAPGLQAAHEPGPAGPRPPLV